MSEDNLIEYPHPSWADEDDMEPPECGCPVCEKVIDMMCGPLTPVEGERRCPRRDECRPEHNPDDLEFCLDACTGGQGPAQGYYPDSILKGYPYDIFKPTVHGPVYLATIHGSGRDMTEEEMKRAAVNDMGHDRHVVVKRRPPRGVVS